VEIGNKDIKLEYLEEAFTTSNWIVRIYKVKPPKNRSWGIFASEVVRAITSDKYIIVKNLSGYRRRRGGCYWHLLWRDWL